MTPDEKNIQRAEMSARLSACSGKAAAAQHASGKMTARERIDFLLDPGSFCEIGLFARHACTDFGMEKREVPADGVVTGFGTVDGRKVFVYAQDFTAMGGSLGRTMASKITRIMDMALREGAPVIGMNDSGGARIQEGVDALAGCGELFHYQVLCSGKIPQLTLIMGPCAGVAAYSPALTDLVLMTEKNARMFCTGPGVLKSVTFEDVDSDTLGGARTHAAVTGEVHLTAPDDAALLTQTRRLLSYLPSSCREKPPAALRPASAGAPLPGSSVTDASAGKPLPGSRVTEECAEGQSHPDGFPGESRPALNSLLPADRRHAYDMKKVIGQIADEGSILELQPRFADNLITALARIGGRVCGIVANQPWVMAGCLDYNAADKGARFVNFCDAFNIPVLSLVDTPGFLPGIAQEQAGLLRHGAKMLYAFNAARVPKITVLLRKAYGGAYMAMGNRESRADLVLAWPTAEIAVMGADGAVDIIFKKEIAAAKDPAAERARLAELYTEKFSSPYYAAGKGYIDRIIDPADTREELLAALTLFADRPIGEKRGNIPL
ncbi:MAG: acyl-CoA carboxylase subunit beta [Eubacteriales bacterium]|nr:acyl-CoA carboxylase subunit beta [Eubacteriales bacterium]